MAKKTLTPPKAEKKFLKMLFKISREHGLAISFIIASLATVGSLGFSEILKYPPCSLCWYQRIFMFPLPIILGIALYNYDFEARRYSMVLASIGALVALYQYIFQMTSLPLPCLATEVVSCSTRYFTLLGFITIPLLSAIAFLAIAILSYLQKE